jgi:Uma2 family endonuclease
MADSTLQFCWIVVLFGNIAARFRDAADVFVGGNLFWYPVEGRPDIKIAPDVLVVFGRPKGHRGSYKQWEEANVPLTVVFEVLSPGNNVLEMADKLDFYDEHGVEEYYLYDPDNNRLLIYQRTGQVLRRVRCRDSHVSPRLGIRFDLTGPEMVVFHPDGRRFLSFEELESARMEAEQQAEQLQQQTVQLQQRMARLAELGRKARRQQASAQELAELERLEGESGPSR